MMPKLGTVSVKHFDFDAFGHGGVARAPSCCSRVGCALSVPSVWRCGFSPNIFSRRRAAALDDALGNFGEFRVNRSGVHVRSPG